jgi:hypothetical protein
MGMLFGGWAEEENEKSDKEKARDKGWQKGLVHGWNKGLEAAQLLITQSKCVEHAQKVELHTLIEKLKKEE